MLKPFLRFCAGLSLCALLVFAPELYQSVRAPYDITVPQRILLRIALCSNQTQAADIFYSALTIYMKEHPSLHIRVTRSSADELFVSPGSSPDLYVFPESLLPDSSLFLCASESGSPITVVAACDGETLLCGVSSDSAHPQQALSLLSHLNAQPSADRPQ